MDQQERRTAKEILSFWPLILVLLSGIVACFKFYFTVTDLSENQKKWQEQSGVIRTNIQSQFEDVRTRITELEQWKDDTGRQHG